MQLRNVLLIIAVLFSRDMWSMWSSRAQAQAQAEANGKRAEKNGKRAVQEKYFSVLDWKDKKNQKEEEVNNATSAYVNHVYWLEKCKHPEYTYSNSTHLIEMGKMATGGTLALAVGFSGILMLYNAVKSGELSYAVFGFALVATDYFFAAGVINHDFYQNCEKTKPIILTEKQIEENSTKADEIQLRRQEWQQKIDQILQKS